MILHATDKGIVCSMSWGSCSTQEQFQYHRTVCCGMDSLRTQKSNTLRMFQQAGLKCCSCQWCDAGDLLVLKSRYNSHCRHTALLCLAYKITYCAFSLTTTALSMHWLPIALNKTPWFHLRRVVKIMETLRNWGAEFVLATFKELQLVIWMLLFWHQCFSDGVEWQSEW
jgi:hypothetical protein